MRRDTSSWSGRGSVLLRLLILAGLASSLSLDGKAQDGPSGITTPIILPPFDPASASCEQPPDLRRALAFARDNDREFMGGIGRGLAAAAADRGLTFEQVSADNDAGRMIEQVEALRASRTGAVVAAPVDPESLAPSLKRMIWGGSYVGTIVPPPAVSLLNAPQYLTGKVLGEAAAEYIQTKLGGRAKVVILTHDSLEFLAPRFTAIRDAIRAVPGAVVIADISPETVDAAGGASTMRTVLLANPDVDVVLGADTVVLGALSAARSAGKASPRQFFGGIDGEREAVAELRKPDSPFKMSVSLASSVFGYAMGQHAADWLDGKSIPQAIDILPIALTPKTLSDYELDQTEPASVYRDARRRNAYLKFYGNICYTTRERYLNFPWSSEAR